MAGRGTARARAPWCGCATLSAAQTVCGRKTTWQLRTRCARQPSSRADLPRAPPTNARKQAGLCRVRPRGLTATTPTDTHPCGAMCASCSSATVSCPQLLPPAALTASSRGRRQEHHRHLAHQGGLRRACEPARTDASPLPLTARAGPARRPRGHHTTRGHA